MSIYRHFRIYSILNCIRRALVANFLYGFTTRQRCSALLVAPEGPDGWAGSWLLCHILAGCHLLQ
jgi:hypothetical protein